MSDSGAVDGERDQTSRRREKQPGAGRHSHDPRDDEREIVASGKGGARRAGVSDDEHGECCEGTEAGEREAEAGPGVRAGIHATYISNRLRMCQTL